MCEECLRTPCHPKCPNHEDKNDYIVAVCECGYEIMNSDGCYLKDGKHYCLDCIERVEPYEHS